MAEAAELLETRLNVDEPGDDTFTDDYIMGLIDALGVDAASAKLWRQKAAKYASLVNVSEAGASHAFSDLHKHALAMSEKFDAEAGGSEVAAATGVRISTITRPSEPWKDA